MSALDIVFLQLCHVCRSLCHDLLWRPNIQRDRFKYSNIQNIPMPKYKHKYNFWCRYQRSHGCHISSSDQGVWRPCCHIPHEEGPKVVTISYHILLLLSLIDNNIGPGGLLIELGTTHDPRRYCRCKWLWRSSSMNYHVIQALLVLCRSCMEQASLIWNRPCNDCKLLISHFSIFLYCFFNIAFCYLFCSANIGQFYFQLAKSGFNLRQCSPGWRWQWWVWTSWWSPWLSLGPSSTCRWSSICPTLDTVCTV